MSAAPVVIDVASVTKRFSTTLAVDAVDLEVREGEILALLGPNGAGKSTIVRMLVGILRPDAGRITFGLDGQERARPEPRDLGYLPEERGLVRDVPVIRTLEHFGVLRGMERAEARERARAELVRFGLGDRGEERVDRLSKGNQQKVQFLAAVLHRPRIAILDEPFSGFDPVNQQRFVEEIRHLREQGCTVLLSAHQMDLVEQLADRLVLMDRGRIVLEGTLDEIRARTSSGEQLEVEVAATVPLEVLSATEGVERARWSAPGRACLGLAREADLGRVLHQITGGVEVRGVRTASERLHEIFLRAVDREVDVRDVVGDRERER